MAVCRRKERRMIRILSPVVLLIVASGLVASGTRNPGAAAHPTGLAQQQRPACLHGEGESASERARRVAAVGMARAINTEQARRFPATRAYGALSSLTLPPVPQGFSLSHTS